MGDMVNQAARLASRGGKSNGFYGRTSRIYMDGVLQQNLDEHNQGLTTRLQSYPSEVYTSNAVSLAMWDWYEKNNN